MRRQRRKLTMVSVDGVVKFVRIPVDYDGKVRVSPVYLARLFNIKSNQAFIVG